MWLNTSYISISGPNRNALAFYGLFNIKNRLLLLCEQHCNVQWDSGCKHLSACALHKSSINHTQSTKNLLHHNNTRKSAVFTIFWSIIDKPHIKRENQATMDEALTPGERGLDISKENKGYMINKEISNFFQMSKL
jgi:hypothetical protein